MSTTDYSLEAKSTRWGEAVVAAAITQRPLRYVLNSTYNEHLDLLAQEHISTTKVPAIKWIGLGIGSDYMEKIVHPISNAIIDNPNKYIHSNEDAIPFIPFPYVMRKVGEDDLSDELRSKLGMRAILDIKGVKWNAWFLKAGDRTNDRVGIDVITTDSNGVVTGTAPLAPSKRPLEPKRELGSVGQTPSSNEYLRTRSTLTLSLTAGEVGELLNCAKVLFGSTDIEITEFAMVAGIEHPTVVKDGPTSISYTEVIGAQSTHFSQVNFSAAQRADVGIKIEFKIGQSIAI